MQTTTEGQTSTGRSGEAKLVEQLKFYNRPQAPNGKYVQKVPRNKYKTSLCKNFNVSGSCAMGSLCNFAHGEADLRGGTKTGSTRDGVYKTVVCKLWQEGECKWGDVCRFAHGYHELRNGSKSSNPLATQKGLPFIIQNVLKENDVLRSENSRLKAQVDVLTSLYQAAERIANPSGSRLYSSNPLLSSPGLPFGLQNERTSAGQNHQTRSRSSPEATLTWSNFQIKHSRHK